MQAGDLCFILTAESAPAGIAALVPVGSAPELSHKRTEPQPSCQACGIYLHGLIRKVIVCHFALFQHRVDMKNQNTGVKLAISAMMLSDVRIAQIVTLTQF